MTDTTFDLADSLTCGHPLTSSPFCPQCGAEVSSAQRTARFGHTAEAHPPAGMTTTGSPLFGAPAPVDNSRAWLLAVAPLLSLCISAGLLFSGFSHAALLGIAVAIGVNTLIAVWDSRFLKGQGYDVSTTLAVLLVPVYLLRRSRVLGHHQAPLATWIAVFILAFAGDAILSSRFVTIDMSVVEAEIREDFELDASANVVCPGKAVHTVKSTFMCEVSDSGAKAMVLVKVEDSDGLLTWEVVGAKLAGTEMDLFSDDEIEPITTAITESEIPETVPTTAAAVPKTRIAEPQRQDFTTLSVGTCFNEPDENDLAEVVPCSGPHELEMLAKLNLWTDASRRDQYPGDAAIERETERQCDEAFERYVGVPYDNSSYDFVWLSTDSEKWEQGDGRGFCVIGVEGETLTGSARGSRR